MSKRAILWLAVSSTAQAAEDKESIPEQDRKLRAVAEREGWQIVDTILVPGFSRVFYNYPEFAEAAARENIPAPARMLEHWHKRDFDIFACISGDRFGRSQSIFAEVVERTTDAGADVYTIKDGYIHIGNRRMFVAMAGYGAASEIDELMRRKDFGMRGRASRGLPTGSKLPLFLKLRRDERGKAIETVINEDLRRLWDDLATVILDRVRWENIGLALYERYGHVRADGTPYKGIALYEMIMSPSWWGHDAMYHQYKGDVRTKQFSPWIWDEGEPVQDGVLVYRNTHPAVWTGTIAEQMKAELWRRHSVVRGKAGTDCSRFSGLLICATCGYGLCLHKKKTTKWRGWRCTSRYSTRRVHCPQTKLIGDQKVEAYINERLKLYLERKTLAYFEGDIETPDFARQINQLESEIAVKKTERRTAIREQMRAQEDAQQDYRDEIEQVSKQITLLQQRLDSLRFEEAHLHRDSRLFQQTIEAIREMKLEQFWKQPDGAINQALHNIYGKRRIVVDQGAIKGTIPRPRARKL